MTRQFLTPEQMRGLGGEALRREAKWADAGLHHEIERVRRADPAFHDTLSYALAVEEEQDRRRNR